MIYCSRRFKYLYNKQINKLIEYNNSFINERHKYQKTTENNNISTEYNNLNTNFKNINEQLRLLLIKIPDKLKNNINKKTNKIIDINIKNSKKMKNTRKYILK